MKIIVCFFLYFFSAVLIVPAAITYYYNSHQGEATTAVNAAVNEARPMDSITYYDGENKITQIDFDDYIIGVVAAEMPASFEEEALKAQGVAARTYAVRHIDFDRVYEDLSSIGQEYLSPEEMEERWGTQFVTYFNKISRAVYSTAGEIITYDGEVIDAVFHSTSPGLTENSSDVWHVQLPYLVSVPSEPDKDAPGFEVTQEFTLAELAAKLSGDIEIKTLSNIKVHELTETGFVKTVDFNGAMLDGLTLRQRLSLRSNYFTISLWPEENPEKIIFTTKGYGHGAGMSQYGANAMAKEGYNYQEILKHYYTGVHIEALPKK